MAQPFRPRPNRRRAAACALTVAALATGLAGCGGSSSSAGTTTTTATTTAAATVTTPVPRPTGATVLTMSGSVSRPNVGRRVVFDMAGLEHGGASRITLYEPFKKRDMSFRAVRFRDVLAAAGVTGGTLHMTALNDYSVDVPFDVAAADGVWLATRNGDGSAIRIADGGPIRLVFAKDAKGADVDRYWIWSISAIDVT